MSGVKVWSGSAWVEKPVKVWSGSAWVEKPVKVWSGSSWVTISTTTTTTPPVGQSFQAVWPNTNSLASLVTTAITVNNGDLLVVKTSTWGSNPVPGTPTAPGQTFTVQATSSTVGFCYVIIATAIVTGSPGTLVVTQPFGGSSGQRSMVVERWSNAKLATTPAVNATKSSTSANGFSASVTTAVNNSVVTWTAGDYDGDAPGTPGYRSGAVEETHNQVTNYAFYDATQAAAVAGTQTFGLTTPAVSARWSYLALGIEPLA